MCAYLVGKKIPNIRDNYMSNCCKTVPGLESAVKIRLIQTIWMFGMVCDVPNLSHLRLRV